MRLSAQKPSFPDDLGKLKNPQRLTKERGARLQALPAGMRLPKKLPPQKGNYFQVLVHHQKMLTSTYKNNHKLLQ